MNTQTQRIDAGELAAPVVAKIYSGVAAKAHPIGAPLKYSHGDEHRDLAEVQKIVAALPGQPITYNHGGRSIGTVLDAKLDGDRAVARLLVTDESAMADIGRGAVQLSLGYNIAVEDRAGTTWQVVDSVFELALVPNGGRCGPECSLRGDRQDCATECACTEKARADAEQEAKAKASHAAVQLAIAAGRGLVLDDNGRMVMGTARTDTQPSGAEALKAAEEANRKRLANAWRREGETK